MAGTYDKLVNLSLLSRFLDKAKLLFATKDTATTSAAGLMSAADKLKLDGLSPGGSSALVFTSVSVPASAWQSIDDEDFACRAAVTLSGVTAQHVPLAVFTPTQIAWLGMGPVAESYSGGVYLYAAETVEDDITVPTIVCIK